MPVTLREIRAARRRIADGICLTPCPESIPLGELDPRQPRVFCKLENFQRTGSFKERGARNALLLLGAEQRKRGVIAASAGNHALGLAYHGRLLKIPVTVVMPDYAPLIKITTCQRLGARVILCGVDFAAARVEADRIADTEGLAYVHGFDAEAIIAGQGTIGLEVLQQVPRADVIVCPIGGGGLIAGVATAIKALRPGIKVIGVESEATGNYTAALRARKAVTVRRQPTLADGLATLTVGPKAFELARQHVDAVVRVSERWIALAILRMVELEKTVVEGAAAVPLAALMSGQLGPWLGDSGSRVPPLDSRGKSGSGVPPLQSFEKAAGTPLPPGLPRRKNVVLIVGGGNIDPTILSRVIEKGLVHDGRLSRFSAIISDRPGGLAELCRTIADAGASIKDVEHDRAFTGPDVSAARAICTVETRNRAHVRTLHAALRRAGFVPRGVPA